MKITYLSSPISSQYGGGEKFLDDFMSDIDAEHEFVGSSKAIYDLFQSKGYKATLTSGLLEPVSVRNLLLIPVSILVGLFQFIRFYSVFKASDWIISPTSHCETFFVIPWIKIFLRKQVLFMIHTKPPNVFGIFPLNWILLKCWGDSPVTFVSNSQKGLWNEKGCLSKNQVVIYNGVEINKSKIENSPYLGGVIADDGGSLPKSIKIGFIGRLHKEKACDVLINALESINFSQPIEVIIAGGGPEKQNLTSLYEAKKLSPNIKVSFVGFISDTKSFYESLGVLVFPSRLESFGLVICEAMERGLSVITSDIPSSLEIKNIINLKAQSELIFKKDDYKQLASKIDYFIENQGQYLDLEYKKRLHSVIVEKFSLEQMLSEYNKVLNS